MRSSGTPCWAPLGPNSPNRMSATEPEEPVGKWKPAGAGAGPGSSDRYKVPPAGSRNPANIGSAPLTALVTVGATVSETAAESWSEAFSGKVDLGLVNVPPWARNCDRGRRRRSECRGGGAFGSAITPANPNGRLKIAANGAPAAMLLMLPVSTGWGARATSCWLSGAASSSGGPSEPGP